MVDREWKPRDRDLTIDEIEVNFNRCLNRALDSGEHPPTHQGFVPEVSAAISVAALDFPARLPEHVLDARKKWEKQKRGDYDREQEEMWREA